MSRPSLVRAGLVLLSLVFVSLLAGCGQDNTGCTDTGESTYPGDETLVVDQETFAGYLDTDGALTEEACFELCMDNAEAFEPVDWVECRDDGVAEGGGQTLFCSWTETAVCVGGRDSACIDSRSEGVGPDPVSAWAAGTAHAEAASVAAFVALRRELVEHSAPTALVEAAEDAARDEVAHARAMVRIAAARGGKPRRPQFHRIETRDLETIATENVVEGCVRETWAALLACYQAEHARDAEVRAAMVRIAEDETRHAELARAVDGWARTRLDDDAVSRVDAARRTAVSELMAGLREPSAGLGARVGLPPLAVSRRLATSLGEMVWA